MRKILSILALGASLAFATGCQSTDKHENVDPAAVENLAAPVNPNCPMMVDHEVDPEVTVDWNGHTVAFCCEGCIDDWNDMTEEQQQGRPIAAGAKLD